MSSRKQPTQLYSRLSEEQQTKFQDVVIEQLKSLIGGHRELSVLAEYIAVMLQSNRPPEQIESELEAFLQEQSRPFTAWLCKELSKLTGTKESSRGADAKGEALLLRAVQDARQGAAGEAEGRKRSRREKRLKESATVAETPAPRERHRGGEARSRSRPRRRQERQAAREALREVPNGSSVGSREAAEKRKALLTPNVQFLRDAYHQKVDAQHGQNAQALDSRWTFRADPPSATEAAGGPPPSQQAPDAAALPPGAHSPPPMGYAAVAAAPPPAVAPQVTVVKSRYFLPKKWKVARKDTVVRATEMLDSEKVQLLQVGEIVEQVAPAFKLKNGIVRVQIRHPSSPQFPNPIGWVTQDASAAGGPKFLEPGPEPMTKSAWRPSSTWGGEESTTIWRPKGKGAGKGAPPAAPRPAAAPRPYGGFMNLTWTPKPTEPSEALAAV